MKLNFFISHRYIEVITVLSFLILMGHLTCTDSSWRSLVWNKPLDLFVTRSWPHCFHLSSHSSFCWPLCLHKLYWLGRKSSFLQKADQRTMKEFCLHIAFLSLKENTPTQVQSKEKNEHISKYANLLWILTVADEKSFTFSASLSTLTKSYRQISLFFLASFLTGRWNLLMNRDKITPFSLLLLSCIVLQFFLNLGTTTYFQNKPGFLILISGSVFNI